MENFFLGKKKEDRNWVSEKTPKVKTLASNSEEILRKRD